MSPCCCLTRVFGAFCFQYLVPVFFSFWSPLFLLFASPPSRSAVYNASYSLAETFTTVYLVYLGYLPIAGIPSILSITTTTLYLKTGLFFPLLLMKIDQPEVLNVFSIILDFWHCVYFLYFDLYLL